MSDIETKKKRIEDSLRQSYESIASDFDKTRQNVSPELLTAATTIEAGNSVLDLGCGNGRLLKAAPAVNFDYLGIDTNQQLLDQARSTFPAVRFTLSTMQDFDFGQSGWDRIIAIASFHHLTTAEERIEVLKRIYQGLKPGGKLVMTNWRLWQRRYWSAFVRWWPHKIVWNDTFITWNNQFPRYYHAFTERELHQLLRSAGFTDIETRVIRHNYVTTASK